MIFRTKLRPVRFIPIRFDFDTYTKSRRFSFSGDGTKVSGMCSKKFYDLNLERTAALVSVGEPSNSVTFLAMIDLGMSLRFMVQNRWSLKFGIGFYLEVGEAYVISGFLERI